LTGISAANATFPDVAATIAASSSNTPRVMRAPDPLEVEEITDCTHY
jgi:hypothetical protein